MAKPKVGVAVFVFKGKDVLIMKRKSSKKIGDNAYALPGGKLEMFEKLESACTRETFEETGLKIKNLKFIGVTNDIYKNINVHYVTIYYRADYLSGTPTVKEPTKCHSMDWVNFNKLPKGLYFPIYNLFKEHDIKKIYKM